MPTREGKKVRKRHTREYHRQQSQLDDKKTRSNANQSDESMEDNDGFYDDMDSWYSDDSSSSDTNIAGDNDNGRSDRNKPRIPSQPPPENVPTSPIGPPKPHLNGSVKEQDLADRQLPAEIFTIFPNVKPITMVGEILKKIQDEEEGYRTPKDEHGNRTTEMRINSFPRAPIIQHFKQVGFTDFEQEDGKQILNYLQKPILKKSSYGVLLYNSKREILGVKSYRGSWSAPKGHRKIEDDYQLEPIKKTAARKFNEEIRIKNRITNEIYGYYDIDQEHHLNLNKYIEYQFGDISGDNARCVGLFIVEIDEAKLAFDLLDTYDNQYCQWLVLDDILKDIPRPNADKFYTLRPFVEWLKNSLMFSDNNPNH